MAKYTSIRCTHTAVSETREEVGVICDQVVIGTPGKVKSWISRKVLPVKGIRIVVFDEADEMLAQDGFAMDSLMMLKSIVSGKPPGGKDLQVLMFSATFSATVAQFALKLAGPNANKARCPPSYERRARAELAGAASLTGANYAAQIFVPKEKLSLSNIKQVRIDCPTVADKERVLKDFIFPAAEKMGQCIVFVRTRKAAHSLHSALAAAGHKCTSIDGSLPHEDRDKVWGQLSAW